MKYRIMNEQFVKTKQASKSLAALSDSRRNEILLAVSEAIVADKERIIKANAEDLAKMDRENPLYDRLMLTEARLEAIADDMRNVAGLPSPLGHITEQKTLPNGLRLCRISVPFGVIGMIYEARPNVTFDVFSLCFKSGNACVLKGGKDADCSNREEVKLIHEVLERYGVDPDVVALLPATHEATGEMLNAVGYVDLCIPRGGRRLIDFVRDTARIPVLSIMPRRVASACAMRSTVCSFIAAASATCLHSSPRFPVQYVAMLLQQTRRQSSSMPTNGPTRHSADIIHCSSMPLTRASERSSWTTNWR